MRCYIVYIIYSLNSNLHYIAHTSNLKDRLLRHNGNRNKFTKNKGPWELIAAHLCSSKSEACKLELKLSETSRRLNSKLNIRAKNILELFKLR